MPSDPTDRVSPRWTHWRETVDLEEYHRRWERMEASGKATHGEADLIEGYRPASVLDAGCGMGDGLQALRRAYPQARIEGVEWSWPLRLLCGLRCPWARVRRADMWESDWSGYALVYLFQRPETMPRAAGKALAELAPGTWLVSLEFAAPGLLPQAQLRLPGGRVVWMYRIPEKAD